MKVPVQNIYFLLCYAWDRLEEGEIVEVQEEGMTTLPNLFARVLINGTQHLLRRGLDRQYRSRRETVAGVRGRLVVSETVKGNFLARAHTVCEHDDLTHDAAHNRILKATLRYLAQLDEVDRTLKAAIAEQVARLSSVRDVSLSGQLFGTVQLHGNNRFYHFLLKVCQIIQESLFVEQGSGRLVFRDFLHNDAQMATLFQNFVGQFYRRERPELRVRARELKWNCSDADDEARRLLPVMRTDLVLHFGDRRLIVDTKYYRKALQENRGSLKLHSEHLYQICAYVRSLEAQEPGPPVEGMLLYPVVDQSLAHHYVIDGHVVRVRSVNLAQPRDRIHADLLELIT